MCRSKFFPFKTFKTAESEISSPNLGSSADLDRWDYYFFSSKRSLCLGPQNEMMLLSWHFWCACCPSRFYLARLSFACFKDAGNLKTHLTHGLCLEWYKERVYVRFFSNLLSAYWFSSLYHKEKLKVIAKMWIYDTPLFANFLNSWSISIGCHKKCRQSLFFWNFAHSNLGEILPKNGVP